MAHIVSYMEQIDRILVKQRLIVYTISSNYGTVALIVRINLFMRIIFSE
jgi:hypothetical protein